jgi:hypothetical protein
MIRASYCRWTYLLVHLNYLFAVLEWQADFDGIQELADLYQNTHKHT